MTTNVNALTLITTVDGANELVLFIDQSTAPVRMALSTLIQSIEDEGVRFLMSGDVSGTDDLVFTNVNELAYIDGLSYKFFVQRANIGVMRARVDALPFHPVYYQDGVTRIPAGAVSAGLLITFTFHEAQNRWVSDLEEPTTGGAGVTTAEVVQAIADHTAIQFAHGFPYLYFVPSGDLDTTQGFIQLTLPTGFPVEDGRSFVFVSEDASPADWRARVGGGGTLYDIYFNDAVTQVTADAIVDDEIVTMTFVNRAGLSNRWMLHKPVPSAVVVDRDTDLAVGNRGATTLDVTSSTGTDATIPEASTSEAGLESAADKFKLDGIAAGATTDQSATSIVALIQGLSGNDRLQAAAIRLISDAIDVELGATTWRTGGGGVSDGVITSGTFNVGATEINIITSTGGAVTIDVPASLRSGSAGNGTLDVVIEDNVVTTGANGNLFVDAGFDLEDDTWYVWTWSNSSNGYWFNSRGIFGENTAAIGDARTGANSIFLAEFSTGGSLPGTGYMSLTTAGRALFASTNNDQAIAHSIYQFVPATGGGGGGGAGTPEEIRDALETLLTTERLEASAIQDIATELDNQIGTFWRLGTAVEVREVIETLQTINRLDASALQMIGEAIDQELGSTVWRTGGTGTGNFIGLTDTPSVFGSTGQVPVVNSGRTALEFADQSTDFLALSDTPAAYGSRGQVPVVNAGTDGLEFGNLSVHQSDQVTLSGNTINLRVPTISGGPSAGDNVMIVFRMTNTPTAGNLYRASINSSTGRDIVGEDGEQVRGERFNPQGTYAIIRTDNGDYGLIGADSARWAIARNTQRIPTDKIPGTLIHLATAVTYTPITFSVTTADTVNIGDLILLETPAAWTEAAALVGIDVNGTGSVAFTDRAEISLTDQDISPETWYLVARNSSATAWTVVTSLRGVTRSQVRAEIADWAETSNTDQIPAAKIPGLATASGRYFAIPTANVSGDADNYILSTGDNLGTLSHGDRFFFHPPANNNGALTITIDSVAALTLRKSNGQGGHRDSQDNDLYANVPTIVTYDESTDNLQLGIATIGSAAYRNAGVGSSEIPILGAGGILDTERLAAGRRSQAGTSPYRKWHGLGRRRRILPDCRGQRRRERQYL